MKRLNDDVLRERFLQVVNVYLTILNLRGNDPRQVLLEVFTDVFNSYKDGFRVATDEKDFKFDEKNRAEFFDQMLKDVCFLLHSFATNGQPKEKKNNVIGLKNIRSPRRENTH